MAMKALALGQRCIVGIVLLPHPHRQPNRKSIDYFRASYLKLRLMFFERSNK